REDVSDRTQRRQIGLVRLEIGVVDILAHVGANLRLVRYLHCCGSLPECTLHRGSEELPMIILDIPRKTTRYGKYIDIPVYHRTHLGLSHDTTVHFCLLPARAVQPDEGSVPELVVAPFRFDDWGQLWRLTTSVRDQPGLVNAIADTMAQCSVNIIACESNISQEEGMYHLE